ncbi:MULTISPECIES: hypothetical protein [unclassified Methylophaga]|uniref:hypothetical protein n=1 Tax=unclassified Methylophaga TaxID=2629249 RepID=UPI000C8BF6FF|nr:MULTISPECIES: hypothetical protein [unclassified Methylophaga]MBN44989.1 hypothetical protein [Methylophaga sp.]|tara:strand:- start:69392 stop:71179 length:1788 start_codon:yes stop_codon:yes gene_type:complete
MNLNTLSALKNISFGKPSQILVCESDGLSLRAAVISREGSRLVTHQHALSNLLDPGLALTEVINTIRANGWSGNQAVLLTPAAMSSLIELPINPKKPKPLAQMQALIRWEAEPLLMQQQNQWSIGYLMIKQGLMTAEQVNHIRGIQQANKPAGMGIGTQQRSNFQRFGELALEHGYVDKERLNGFVQCQSWLRSDEEEIECGWQPQGAVKDAPGIYNWLISCVYKSVINRWVDAFKTHGINLLQVFPLTGASNSLLKATNNEQLLIESGPGIVTTTGLSKGLVNQFQVHHSASLEAYDGCLEAYHAANTDSIEEAWLSCHSETDNQLYQNLGEVLTKPIHFLSGLDASTGVTPGILGAASHVTGIYTGTACVPVRVGGEKPPLIQRQEIQFAGVAAILLLVIMASEVTMHVQQTRLVEQKTVLDERARTLDEAVRRITAINEQIEARKNLLKQQQTSQQRMEARMAFFGEELPERNMLLQAVLGTLQNALNDHIVINSIDEMGKRLPMMAANQPVQSDFIELDNFNIDAWSLTESAAQEFIQALKDSASTWNLIVRDVQILERSGPLNLDGYAVALSLVKVKPRPLQISQSEQNQ